RGTGAVVLAVQFAEDRARLLMCLEHLGPIGAAVRERLGLPHCVAKLLMLEARPDSPTAGHREEPHLAIARLAPEELEHGLRIGTGQPFGFGHGRSPYHNYPTAEGDSILLPEVLQLFGGGRVSAV